MRLVRRVDGSAIVLNDAGHAVLEVLPLGSDDDADDALAGLEHVLAGPPRVVIGLKEGVLASVQADIPCEVVVIEEDPFDTPPLHLRRRAVAPGDPETVTAVIALAEQRRTRMGGG